MKEPEHPNFSRAQPLQFPPHSLTKNYLRPSLREALKDFPMKNPWYPGIGFPSESASEVAAMKSLVSNEPGHSRQVEPKALEEVSGTEDENPSGGGNVGDGTTKLPPSISLPQMVVEK